MVFAAHVETSSGILLPDDYLRAVADAVHAVGGGSPRAPRVAILRWDGAADGPLVALCGKRVAHAWVDYDAAGAEYIAERCVALWHHVETGTRPPAAGADIGELRKLPRVVATVDRPDLAPVLARHIAAGAAEKAAKRERDNLAAQIRDALDSASVLTAGTYRATRTSNDRLTVTHGE
jgi:hypothetical protein